MAMSDQITFGEKMMIFGLKIGFGLNDLKKSYKKLVLIHHPDKGGKHEMFILVKKMYDELRMSLEKTELNDDEIERMERFVWEDN